MCAAPSEACRGRPQAGLAPWQQHPTHCRPQVNRHLGAEAGTRRLTGTAAALQMGVHGGGVLLMITRGGPGARPGGEDLPHGGPELKWAEGSGGSTSDHLGPEAILGSGLGLLTWLLSLVPLDLALGTPGTQN